MLRLVSGLLAIAGFVLSFGALAGPFPAGMEPNRFNGRDPTARDGIVTFEIFDEECSDRDFGDGRGESDCLNGTVRSGLVDRFRPIGETYEYSFDVRIDPGFAYEGFQAFHATGFVKDGWDSRFRLAIWEGNLLHNFIYQLVANTKNGMTFLGNQCQAPDKFGEWVRFSMSVRWTNDEKGWIKVTCDDRLIYLKENVATTTAPHCYPENICEPGIPKAPKKVLFQIGALMWGNGFEWKQNGKDSAFTHIQPGGITVQMRNVVIGSGGELYGAADKAIVKELQEILAGLGCDPGPADGVAGQRTREAALYCRNFGEGKLPEVFDVSTAPIFLELYKSLGAADLPPGVRPGDIATISADFVVHARETSSQSVGDALDIDSSFEAIAEGTPKGQLKIRFSLYGIYVPKEQNFYKVELIMSDPVKEKDVFFACGATTEEDDDGKHFVHIPLKIAKKDGTLSIRKRDCLLEALPDHLVDQVSFLANHFSDIAVGLVRDGKARELSSVHVREFIERVAQGDIKVVAVP